MLKFCRNFTTVVPVRGTLSAPRLLNSLGTSSATGAVNWGTAGLPSACSRYTRATDSGSTFTLPPAAAANVNDGCAASAAPSAAIVGPEASSVLCIENDFSPFSTGLCAFFGFCFAMTCCLR